MATLVGGSNEIDVIDIAPLILYPVFAFAIFGIFSLEVTIFGVHSMTGALWTVAGVDISIALLGAVGSAAVIVATNEINGSNYKAWEFAIIALSLLAPILYVVLPSFAQLVHYHDLVAVGFGVLAAGATIYVAWTE